MTIKLNDSLSGTIQEFVPQVAGRVGIYQCGPTVQSAPHIGHLRSAVVYDVWRKWFEYRGFQVTLVRNVTDIDDKILVNANIPNADGQTEDWRALAYRVEREFNAAYRSLGVASPTVEPRATGHMTQIVELITRLIDRGFAYVADDGSGDVYFHVTKWPDYGKLTRQNLDDLSYASDGSGRAKQSPYDFALWKGHKTSEPETASWPAPWGRGRPGWHIECSAMSSYYLGEAFDIHGGGLDLRFPHHENEIAQSEAAGYGFASYWIHNGLVTVDGQKMSKSLGNSVYAADLFAKYSPVTLRYFLIQAHYRSLLDLSDTALNEVDTALSRVFASLDRAEQVLAEHDSAETTSHIATADVTVPERFAEAMDDDLNTPQAIAVLHDSVRQLNILLEQHRNGHQSPEPVEDTRIEAILNQVVSIWSMLRVLGLDTSRWENAQTGGALPATAHSGVEDALDSVLSALIIQREQARAEKDFNQADAIRDIFSAAGIEIEDGAEGSVWRIR